MKAAKRERFDFDFHVERDRIRVRFVSQRTLGRLRSGHSVTGDFGDLTIRLPRREYQRSQRALLLHELGHYLVDRQELNPRGSKRLPSDTTEEDVCDLLTWLPAILNDERNGDLLSFLGLAADC